MHGIVSLLDDEHYALVEDIWAELEKEFGVHGLYTTPFRIFPTRWPRYASGRSATTCRK